MWRQFRQVVNAPNHRDLTALDPMNLYRRFITVGGKRGKWGITLAKSTWYANLKRNGFSIKKPFFAPVLSQEHIAARKTFAETEVRFLDNRVRGPFRHYARRIISMDAAKFSIKFNASFAANGINIVVDKENPVEHFFGQLDRSTSYEAYGAFCWGDRTDLMFTMEQDPSKVSHPTADHVVEFIEKELVPMAKRLRERLGLRPNALLFVLLDGAGVHKARKVLTALHVNNMRLAGLAPKCPECQPIETAWFMAKTSLTRLRMTKRHRTDPKAFFALVRRAWRGLSKESMDNLIASYPNRVRSLLAVNGRNFKFNGRVHEVVAPEDVVAISDDEDSEGEDE